MSGSDKGGLQIKTVEIPLSEYKEMKQRSKRLEGCEGKIRELTGELNRLKQSDRRSEGKEDALLTDVVYVLDDFNRGIQSALDGVGYEGIIEGLRLVSRKVWSILTNKGVTEIEASQGRFDPNYHEILEEDSGPVLPGAEIAKCLRTGYIRENRILRKAIVELAPGKSQDPT